MNIDNITIELKMLPINETNNFFLEYRPVITTEYAETLIGKYIYFTWKHKLDNEIIGEYTTGKVLDYVDNKLKVYTHYVMMLEADLKDPNNLKDNEFIQMIPLSDITDVAEFTEYVYEVWETLPDDYYGKIYEITNMENERIIAIAYDFDGINLYLAYKKENNGKVEIMYDKYPISLIKSMKEVI